MKTTILSFFICLSFASSAQVVTGLYTGTMYNDTTKLVQTFELALSEYRGKVTGYSYVTFVMNDQFYYGIRRIKATKKDGKLIIEDDKLIADNFPERPAKGVRRITIVPLNISEDTLRDFKANWQTNRTRQYYAVTGNMAVARDHDSTNSALIRHLKELRIIEPDQVGQVYVRTGRPIEDAKPKKETPKAARTEPPKTTTQPVTQNPKPQTKTTEPAVTATPKPKATETPVTATATTTAPKPKATETPVTVTAKPKEIELPQKPAVAAYNDRKNKLVREMVIRNDSVTLSLYDNGVVDGDEVSVLLNGSSIVSRTKLTQVALKKKIAIDSDSLMLTLVADNLGDIPPNTGLLVVQDGDEKYNLYFSADFETNATIVFRKRKKE